MSPQPPNSPLGTFLAALRKAHIDCILIGNMAAIRQGAPLMTVDYDFWVRLPEREYVKLLAILERQGGSILARTVYELSDGTQVNAIVRPDGLRPFSIEFEKCPVAELEGQPVRVLPLPRVIASKRRRSRHRLRQLGSPVPLFSLPVLEHWEHGR
jgi:hypothetical protein